MQSKDDSLGMVYVRGGAPHTVKMVCFRDRLSENWASLWESSCSAVTADSMCIFSSSLQCSEIQHAYKRGLQRQEDGIRPLSVFFIVLETADIPLLFSCRYKKVPWYKELHRS